MADETRPPEPAPDGAAADLPAEPPRPALGRITRVRLKNSKSIVSCDVQLEPLTLLVGPNGSGKSNFLDALSFVKQAVVLGPDQAIRNRGNLDTILSAARPPGDDSFSIALDFELPDGRPETYDFTIVSDDEYGFALSEHTERAPMPRPIYDLLRNMVFYNPQPDQLRAPVEHDASPRLSADGRNAASILGRFQASNTDDLHGVTPYLKRVLPGLEAIKVAPFQGYDHLTFVLRQGAAGKTTELSASQMSDGTLRALAVLIALFQGRLGGKSAPSLVGIEEPENTIHPAAARILLAAMQSASYHTQVIATTHSADMLHMGNADLRSVLVVSAEDGITKIGPIDAVSQGIVRDNIYTLGELLQMDQLFPESSAHAANGDAASHQPVTGGT